MRRHGARSLALAALVGVTATAFARPAAAANKNADPTNYTQVLATLQPGDTLDLAAGTYDTLALSNLNGTPTQWITITGPAVTPPTAIIQASPDGCCNVVEIVSSSYLAIENLLVDGNHVNSAYGISAKGETSNLVHDIRIESCTLVNMDNDGDPDDMGQQDDGISTKTPTWGWIIRHNTIVGAGTGLYLGNSTGSDPFIGGLIEDNLVMNPTGYCMEIKFQNPRPDVTGMPTSPTSTIIRNNVFIKNDHPATTSGTRPQLLVGGFPATGAGAEDRYEIYGNFFDHDADDSLMQASGRVTIHDNVFVDAPNQRAIALQDQDLPLELAYVYDNTIYGMPDGIIFGSSAPQGDAVYGNLVLVDGTAISGPIAHMANNLTDTTANAPMYVTTPSTTLGQMDFYPKPGQCTGPAIDTSLLAMDTDYAIDFNCAARGFEYRGAYAGAGTNPGWKLAAAIKAASMCISGDAGADAGGAAKDAGSAAGSDGGTASLDGSPGGDGSLPTASSGKSGGCACDVVPKADSSGARTLWAMMLGLAAFASRHAQTRRGTRRDRRVDTSDMTVGPCRR